MSGINRVRDIIRKLYRDYGGYITAAGKFLTALILFLQINIITGGTGLFSSFFVILILALFCSFLPDNAIIVTGTAVAIAQLVSVSAAAAAVGGSLLLIVLLLYFSFAPKQAWAFLLTFLAVSLHIPCIIPLGFGLMGTPLSVVGIIAGTVVYYTLAAIGGAGAAEVPLAMAGTEEAVFSEIRRLTHAVLQEQEMILMLIALLAVFVVVYFARRMAMDHAWAVAIASGTVIYLVLMAAGWMMLEMDTGIVWILLGTLLSVLTAVLLEVFFFHLDYRRKEKVQFEDDDYYYYVQAIPKKRSEKESKRKIDRKGREYSDGNETIYP